MDYDKVMDRPYEDFDRNQARFVLYRGRMHLRRAFHHNASIERNARSTRQRYQRPPLMVPRGIRAVLAEERVAGVEKEEGQRAEKVRAGSKEFRYFGSRSTFWASRESRVGSSNSFHPPGESRYSEKKGGEEEARQAQKTSMPFDG